MICPGTPEKLPTCPMTTGDPVAGPSDWTCGPGPFAGAPAGGLALLPGFGAADPEAAGAVCGAAGSGAAAGAGAPPASGSVTAGVVVSVCDTAPVPGAAAGA